MFNRKSLNITYLYDGTIEGLFSIIFKCYLDASIPCAIYPEKDFEPNFIEQSIFIPTEEEKADRISKGILNTISYLTAYNTYYSFLCSEKGKEMSIVKYLLDGFQIGPRINNRLSIDYVFDVHRMRKKTFGECHRLKGLVRLSEISPHLFYGKFHPDNAILEPLGHHFMQRLSAENLILHDKNRNLLFLYNTKEYKIIDGSGFIVPDITEKEKEFQELWKTFFHTISIKERSNSRLQMQYMPKKYWKDIIEMDFN